MKRIRIMAFGLILVVVAVGLLVYAGVNGDTPSVTVDMESTGHDSNEIGREYHSL